MEAKWVVHVIGPDEIHDMPDEITALREANTMNQQVVEWRTKNPSPNNPCVVAVVKNISDEPC